MKFDRISEIIKTNTVFPDGSGSILIHISASDDADVTNISGTFVSEAEKNGIPLHIIITGPTGYYDLEPLVRIEKPGKPSMLFRNVDNNVAGTLVREYLVSEGEENELPQRPPERTPRNDNLTSNNLLCSMGPGTIEGIPDCNDLPLFSLQRRVALRNCGMTDPRTIDHYLAHGNGYTGLDKSLRMSPGEVVAELEQSGLRGRGGAGYTAAEKWRICRDAEGDEKYVVCNAVDADPDSLTVKLLLESDPHSVLEGMLIAAYAVGASHCLLCVSPRKGAGRKRIEDALEQMKGYTLVGDNILDSGFSCTIELREVAGSFVSGEETALICAVEGRQPIPYLRTVYPAVRGINEKPTLVNSVETLSAVSGIFQNGAEWYSGTGGTKVVMLAGDVQHRRTVEVSFGTTLRSMVMDIGGGVRNGGTLKAIRFGGPTGSLFDTDSLDIGIDYESMRETGGIIGSGVIRVYDNSRCAVEITRDCFDYIQSESCGKCVFCREGSLQIYDILNAISRNEGKPGDLELITELGEAMKEGSICSLGSTAGSLALSSIRRFGDDYESHITRKKCPAA